VRQKARVLLLLTVLGSLTFSLNVPTANATLTATTSTAGQIFGRDYYANPNPRLNCSTGHVVTAVWSNNELTGAGEDYSLAFAITCTKLNDDRTLSATTEKIVGLSSRTPNVSSACTSGKAANAIRVKTIGPTNSGNTWVLSTGTNCVNSVDYASSEVNSLANNTTPTAAGTVNTYTSSCQAGSYVIGVEYESGSGLHEVGALCGTFTEIVAPVITGPGPSTNSTSLITITENTTFVHAFSANEVSTWSLTGIDSIFFEVTSSGVLTISARDFEKPEDDGNNNTYIVTIRAADASSNIGLQTLTVTISNLNETSTLGAPSISGNAYKGIAISLTVTVNTPGKARFFMDGKRIANCLSVSTTGTYPNFTATCNWKPAVTSRHALSATFTPTDNTFSTANSASSVIWVLKRTYFR
jgi:hypothetical protein